MAETKGEQIAGRRFSPMAQGVEFRALADVIDAEIRRAVAAEREAIAAHFARWGEANKEAFGEQAFMALSFADWVRARGKETA